DDLGIGFSSTATSSPRSGRQLIAIFGWQSTDDGGPDVFVHVHDVETAGMKTLVGGQVLAYNTTPARWPLKGCQSSLALTLFCALKVCGVAKLSAIFWIGPFLIIAGGLWFASDWFDNERSTKSSQRL